MAFQAATELPPCIFRGRCKINSLGAGMGIGDQGITRQTLAALATRASRRCVSLVCQKPQEESCHGYEKPAVLIRFSGRYRFDVPSIGYRGAFLLSAATKNRRPLSVAINYAAGS